MAFKYNPAKEFDLDAWVEDIYRSGNNRKLHWQTINKYANIYWDAVKNGYTNYDVASNDLLTPDGIMLQHLANNVYHFSVAKNYTHLQQLTSLINDNGRIREWKSYKAEADKLNLKFNKTWLKTEYDFALAGSTMASKWAEFDSRGDEVLLRYSTVGDARVRDAHRALEGITLPKNHIFWNTHYPPNGWKCRCDVEVVPNGYAPTKEDAVPNAIDSIPPMMRMNVGKEKLIFPKKHPYFKGEVASLRNENFLPYVSATTPKGFTISESKQALEHTSSEHEALRITKEYAERMLASTLLADEFNSQALLLPNVPKTNPMRDLFYKNNVGFTGNCDGLLPEMNWYYEVKSYDGRYEASCLDLMLDKCAKQAENLVIVLHDEVNMDKLKNSILTKWTNKNKNYRQKIKTIYVVTKNKTLLKIK